MKDFGPYLLIAIGVAAGALRLLRRLRRRAWLDSDLITASPRARELGLVAGRELRERLRGRMFRVGTLLMLVAVAAAIVIPTLHKNHATAPKVGVVSTLMSAVQPAAAAAASGAGTTATVISEPDAAAARNALRTGQVDVAITDGPALLVAEPLDPKSTSATTRFVHTLALTLGEDVSFHAAGLTPDQAAQVAGTEPLPISSLRAASTKPPAAVSAIGIILIFMMLTQYNTWTLIGVMEEKSSRVAEVLLSSVRPARLLTGKVLGIGVAAFAQAGLIVAFALVLAESVGSTLMHGSEPLAVAASLTWLLLGYAFYSWVYAAAGSMAARRDQVQALALPLGLPVLFGYATSLGTITGGSPSTFFHVLAYLPPTAPFAMPTLVGFGGVAWWQFAASAVISMASTVAVARFAAVVYRKSILRTGRRVRVRDLVTTGR